MGGITCPKLRVQRYLSGGEVNVCPQINDWQELMIHDEGDNVRVRIFKSPSAKETNTCMYVCIYIYIYAHITMISILIITIISISMLISSIIAILTAKTALIVFRGTEMTSMKNWQVISYYVISYYMISCYIVSYYIDYLIFK